MTYKELGFAISMAGVSVSHPMRHVRDELSELREKDGEPSLAALVVNSETGAPG